MRRLGQVPVEVDQRPRMPLQGGQGVAEPPLDEANLIIEQAVAIEVRPHALDADGQFLVAVQPVAGQIHPCGSHADVKRGQ